MIFSLYGRAALAADAGLPSETAPKGKSAVITLAYNARAKDEVDAVLAEAEAAGAEIVKPAAEAFWGGYSGYFADPDGHLWEIAFNPFWPIDDEGRITLAD